MPKTNSGRIFIKDPAIREAALEIVQLDKRYPTITDAIRTAILDMLERVRAQQAAAAKRPTPSRDGKRSAS